MILPKAHQAMMKWSNVEDSKRGIPLVWQKNALKNIPYFDKLDGRLLGSIHDMPKYEGKAVIFVGRGQSLKKAIRMFDTIDDRFIIVCTNSSLRYLLENGVVPHYMVCIDGEKGSWTFENLPEKAKDVTAIFAAGACHEEVIKWPGKIMVVPYGVKKGSVQKLIKKRWGKEIAAGGNALNGSVAIFLMNTFIKIYVFVGNNLSFREGESFYFDQPTERDDKAYFVMRDIYGEEVYTDMPMYQYKVWLEQAMMQFFPDCYFVNCSEGILGVDVDNSVMKILHHMPLDMAVEQIKWALDFEKQSTIDRFRSFYQLIYDRGYNPKVGESAWSQILKYMDQGMIEKFTKCLDVGCGTGVGMKLVRDAGYSIYGTDISNNLKKWKENEIADLCCQAPAHSMPFSDNSFDFIYCGDVLEHIPEEYLVSSLEEIYRVGSKNFFFNIAGALEDVQIHYAVYMHVSVKPLKEWMNLIRDVGFKITYAALASEDDKHWIIQARKNATN